MNTAQQKPFRALLHRPGCSACSQLCRLIAGGHSDNTVPALGLALIEHLVMCVPGRTRRFVEKGLKLKEKLHEMMGDNDVILVPPHARLAPEHNWLAEYFDLWHYSHCNFSC